MQSTSPYSHTSFCAFKTITRLWKTRSNQFLNFSFYFFFLRRTQQIEECSRFGVQVWSSLASSQRDASIFVPLSFTREPGDKQDVCCCGHYVSLWDAEHPTSVAKTLHFSLSQKKKESSSSLMWQPADEGLARLLRRHRELNVLVCR